MTTLPNIVRPLPNTVRLPRQRSTRLSYKGADANNNNDLVFPNNDEFWSEFEGYLLNTYSKQTVKATILYSKRYHNIITEANAQELLRFSNQKRMHVMKALAPFQNT